MEVFFVELAIEPRDPFATIFYFITSAQLFGQLLALFFYTALSIEGNTSSLQLDFARAYTCSLVKLIPELVSCLK